MKLLFSSSNTADGFLGDYRLTLYDNPSAEALCFSLSLSFGSIPSIDSSGDLSVLDTWATSAPFLSIPVPLLYFISFPYSLPLLLQVVRFPLFPCIPYSIPVVLSRPSAPLLLSVVLFAVVGFGFTYAYVFCSSVDGLEGRVPPPITERLLRFI